jgi:hypothetical protein
MSTPKPNPLFVDRRPQLVGKPGLHAFLIGVSDYPELNLPRATNTRECLGLHSLPVSSTSAWAVANWLKEHADQFPVPLKTCRLLVSPTYEEVQAIPELGKYQNAELSEVQTEAKLWRADAAESPAPDQNMTLFYFTGHGLRRARDDAALLLRSFGDGRGDVLAQAILVSDLVKGMAPAPVPDYPEIAQRQIYLIDSCRNLPVLPQEWRPVLHSRTGSLWPVDPANPCPDNRSTPSYFATLDGGVAYQNRNGQTLFSSALLEALDQCAEPEDWNNKYSRWHVTPSRLDMGLKTAFKKLEHLFAQHNEKSQVPVYNPGSEDFEIYYPEDPPAIEVELRYDPFDDTWVGLLGEFRAERNCGQVRINFQGPLPRKHTLIFMPGLYTAEARVAHPAYGPHAFNKARLADACGLGFWPIDWKYAAASAAAGS